MGENNFSSRKSDMKCVNRQTRTRYLNLPPKPVSSYLHASSRAAEELVEGGLLALADGVLVEDAVGGEVGGGRVGEAALRQHVLRVEHLGHGEAVPEPVVQGRQD